MKDKKYMSMLALGALVLGSAGSIAYQTHAQTASVTPATTTVAATTDVKTATDTDNIQNDQNGVDAPDAVVAGSVDKETNDDGDKVEAVDKETNDDKGTAVDVQDANDTETADDAAGVNAN